MTREVWLDFLRVTACFMVMVVHSTEPFYLGGDGTLVLSATDAFWVSLFESVCRCCVPLFVIASSYLQFPIHYSTGEFFKRRAVRILVPMAFWTVIYALVWGEPVANFKGLLLNFNYAAGHLWFVYMLVGLYLIMPLLSPWAAKVSRRELEVYIGICLITTLFPFIREAGGSPALVFAADGLPAAAWHPLWGEASWNPFGTFYYLSGFIGYLLAGLYIRRFVSNSRLTGVLGWSMFLLGAVLICHGFLQRMSLSADSFPISGPVDLAVGWEAAISFCGLPVALTAVGLVLVFRRIGASSAPAGNLYRHVVLPLSKAGYGMYLIHMLVLASVSAWMRDMLGIGADGVLGVWTTPVQVLGTSLLSFVAVGLIAVLLQRIPRLGKYIIG